MARSDAPNPFDETDNEPIRVEAGEFTTAGHDHQRTGATSARAVVEGNGMRSRWLGLSQRRRVNLITAVVLVVMVGLVLPTLISLIGVLRREAHAANDAANSVNIVVVSPEVRAAADASDPVLGAVAISSAYVSQATSKQMLDLLNSVENSLVNNDEAATRSLSDAAISYFLKTYVPELTAAVPKLLEQWSDMSVDTQTTIETALSVVKQQNGDDVNALASAVVKLATAIGNGRDEQLRNDVTYVPDLEPVTTPQAQQTTAPTQTAVPQATQQGSVQPDSGSSGSNGGAQNNPPASGNSNSGSGTGAGSGGGTSGGSGAVTDPGAGSESGTDTGSGTGTEG